MDFILDNMDLSMTELALLQQAADWVEDRAWAGEISMQEYESDGGGRWVSEDQGDETSSATDEAGSEPGSTGRDEISTTELQGALAPHESAFQALRSAFEAGFASAGGPSRWAPHPNNRAVIRGPRGAAQAGPPIPTR